MFTCRALTVNADFRGGLPGTFYFDGKARLAGTNPTSPNTISASVLAGNITMTPVDTYDSLLEAYNKIYVLGAMPQDSLNVNAPTTLKVAPTAATGGEAGWSVAREEGSFTPVHIVNPPTDPYVVLSTNFQHTITTGFGVHFPVLEASSSKRQQIEYQVQELPVVVNSNGLPEGTVMHSSVSGQQRSADHEQ